jgi:peptidoglycan/xylan/chitin deacetylase (PgdA/CDA1 family)
MTPAISPSSITLLLYHQIGHRPKPGTNLHCFCTVDRFYSHMAYLRESCYDVISLREAYNSLFLTDAGGKPSIVLTFDDGDASYYDLVVPILKTFEFPSVVFVVSGLLGQRAEWIRLASARGHIMTAAQLRELHASGIEIGSHTVGHPRLTQLSREQLHHEIYDSKRSLEDTLNGEVYSFAYPHGDYSPMVMDMVREAGYECAVTCQGQDARQVLNPYEIPRRYITYQDELSRFVSKLPS